MTTPAIKSTEAIEATLSPAEFRGWLRGNIAECLWRLSDHADPANDARRARLYLDRLVKSLEQEQPVTNGAQATRTRSGV